MSRRRLRSKGRAARAPGGGPGAGGDAVGLDACSVVLCSGPNRTTSEFREALSSLEAGTGEWDEFIRQSIDSPDVFLQILAFGEIGKSGDRRWLEVLCERAKTEENATVLSSIYSATMLLGGFTVEDCAALCRAADGGSRSAALVVLDSLEPHDAIEILREMLESDPDDSLRLAAAERLAYVGSDAGMAELLHALESQEFHKRVGAACALSVLNHPAGLANLRELLRNRSNLSPQDVGAFAWSLLTMFFKLSVEPAPRDAEPAEVLAAVFTRAEEWVESVGSRTDECDGGGCF